MTPDEQRARIATEVLTRLLESGDLELVSTRGVAVLSPGLAGWLRRWQRGLDWSASVIGWLLDQPEVAELYVDDAGFASTVAGVIEALVPTALASPSAPAREPGPSHRREDLEALLRAEPDDLDHQRVYADWLLERDDVFGELIARRVHSASHPDQRHLARDVAIWQRERGEALFGRLAEYLDVVVHLDWAGGFVRAATLGKDRDDPGPYQGAILLRWLLEHRAAMLLRELEIHPFENYMTRDQHHELLAVVLERPRPLLRRLAALHEGGGGEGGELDELEQRLPNLEHLHLQLRRASAPKLVHPHLRTLIWDVLVSPEQVVAFSGARLPRLERLGFGGDLTLPALGSALARAELPSLRHLQIRAEPALLTELLAAPWCRALEQLDLAGGSLDDHAARALAARPWPRLQRLDVSRNQLSAAGLAALAGVCPVLVNDGQRRASDDGWDEDDDEDDDPNAEDYYADVGE